MNHPASSARDADAALGKLAVELGLVTQAQLHGVLGSQGQHRMPLGARLLMEGLLDDAGLKRLTDEQARRAGKPAAAAAPAPDFFSVAPRAQGNEEPTILTLDAESARAAAAGLSLPAAPPAGPSRPAMDRDAPPGAYTEVDAPAPHRVVDRRYEVLDQLGRGGMGIVYRARDLTDGKIVALKMLMNKEALESALKRFEREYRLIAKLEHPNVVRIWSHGTWEGTPYYAMEYVEGQSLGDMIEDSLAGGTPFDLRELARIGRDVALALDAAHREGILHRDIKPDNILITVEGVPKVADFGLSKHVTSQTALTMAGNALGTPVYMPPEQATGRLEKVDSRSDIYSLGASMYEAATGHAPFYGDDPFKIMENVVHQPLVRPSKHRSDVGDLEKVIMKAMEKNSKARYADAASLAEDLDRYLAGEPVQAGAGNRSPASAARARLWIWLAALIAVAFLIGALFAFAGKAHGEPPGPEQVKAAETAKQARKALGDAETERLLGKRDEMKAALEKARTLADQALQGDSTLADAAAVAGITRRRLAELSGSEQEHIEAGATLDRAVGADPANAEVRMERGLAYWFLFTLLRRPAWPILSDPNVPFPSVQPRLDRPPAEMERYRDLAATDLKDVLAKGGEELARAAEAFLAAMGEDAGQVRDAADKALKGQAYRPELLRVRGRARLDLGGVEDARDAVVDFNSYLNLSPGEANVHAERGLALFRGGKPADAIADFAEAERLGAPARDMGWNRAVCSIAAGDDAAALQSLAPVIGPACGDPHRWMSRALLHERAERWDDQLADLVNAGRRAPANEDVQLALGKLQEEMDKPRDALKTFNGLIQQKPDSRRGYLARARLRETLNELAAGIEDYGKALELGPGEASVYIERARYYGRRGDWEKAAGDLEKAVKLDPASPDPQVELGRHAHQQKKYADAVARFDRALALDPRCLDAQIGKGKALLADGKPEAALGALDQAVRDHSDASEAWMARATVALKQYEAQKTAADGGKPLLNRALADLGRVVELDPEGEDGEAARKLLAKHGKEK